MHNLIDETDFKLSEIYSFVNEHAADLYKEIKNSSSTIENNINNKITDIFNINEKITNDINIINTEISKLSKNEQIDLLDKNIKEILNNKDIERVNEVNMLKNEFETKINNQRLKYEQKLIILEKELEKMNIKLKEMQKSPVDKFFDKFRKKK